ncbi:MAG: ABC transporter permease [Clostridiales bacterium]|nr:ABC transporter permease [Clostridiales bacterium]
MEDQEATLEAKIAEIQEALEQVSDGGATETDSGSDEPGNADVEALQTALADAKAALAVVKASFAEVTSGLSEVKTGLAAVETGLAEAETGLAQLDAGLEQIDDGLVSLESGLADLQAQRETAEEQFAAAEAQIAEEEEDTLEDGKEQYASGLSQWQESKEQLDEGKAELEEQTAEAESQFADAWDEIEENEQTLAEAEQELLDGQEELDESTEEAMEELEEAREEIDEIEMTRWYIQSRDSLSGYSNVDSDATAIEGLATFLPLIFFVVAILISLTVTTRMVEEDRGLIGTYKALGFKNREIRRKYVIYASSACLLGGLVGDLCGFIVLPKIIFTFFRIMYMIPTYLLRFQLRSGIVSVLLFLAGILAAVLAAVRGQLVQMPASLMRPLVPRGGTRIFLERIRPVWKRMSFLNKVTARNLFRYKKRLIMTVVGIMGCTGLLVCGFAIKNTVTDLMPRQYENVIRYDILAVVQAEDNDQLLSYMEDEENIESYVNLQVETVSIRNAEEEEESVQIYVIPDEADISSFLKLADTDGNETELTDDGIFVTHSAADVLGLSVGDTVTIQDLSLNEAEIAVALVAENYLGDMIYISESCYEASFGNEYEPNAVLVSLTESCKEEGAAAYADELGAKDGLLSTVSTESLKEEFSRAFTLINLVVYVILVMAAALAFVVLFTLSTTNISERERELATIKVLGFFDREVHLYVNKETLILSSIGIALGLPAGYGISMCLCWALKIPGLYFAVSVHPSTYVICAVTSFVFAVIVNQITNRLLNVIDPVEALKSVE